MTPLGGVFAAVLTPFDERLEPDLPKAITYYRELLAGGCDGLNILGTTGEAMSLSTGQRRALMEALAHSGLPLERMIVGTGASALADARPLTRAAFDCGFAAALVMPPFYYRDAGEDGVLRFFDALFEKVAPAPRSVLLYNFPRMSGITFSPALVSRLLATYPDVIAGVKDSSNDLVLQDELRRLDSTLRIFPGTEGSLLTVKGRGMAGCISGSVCLWPQLASRAWKERDATAASEVTALRLALPSPLIAAVRERVAQQRGDKGWLRSIPPL